MDIILPQNKENECVKKNVESSSFILFEELIAFQIGVVVFDLLKELLFLFDYKSSYCNIKNKLKSNSYSILNKILKSSYDLRKIIFDIFWKDTKYNEKFKSLSLYDLVKYTIVLLKLNIYDTIRNNSHLNYYDRELSIVSGNNNYIEYKLEELIFIKLNELQSVLYNNYITNRTRPTNEDLINKKKTYINVLNIITNNKENTYRCFKTSKNIIRTDYQNKFYSKEVGNIF
jgi:hypothetical protein